MLKLQVLYDPDFIEQVDLNKLQLSNISCVAILGNKGG